MWAGAFLCNNDWLSQPVSPSPQTLYLPGPHPIMQSLKLHNLKYVVLDTSLDAKQR